MAKTIEVPFELEDVELVNTEINSEGKLIITVESTKNGTCCHKCCRHISSPYGHGNEKTLRYTSIFDRETYIRIFPKIFQCPYCSGKPTTTQRLPWYDVRSSHTVAYENHVLLMLVNSTVSDVSIKENLGYDAVEGILDRRISTKIDWKQIKKLGILGIDEISRKKGHKDFVTIVTARVDGKTLILAVLKDRTKETVKEFLSSIPKKLRKTIAAVCSDMYKGGAVKEVLKGVKIVVDRFHVALLYRKSLDSLRKSEMKRLKKELPKEKYQELKNVMWILRKHPNELTCKEKIILK